jgi:ornithine carbamoyltransferase
VAIIDDPQAAVEGADAVWAHAWPLADDLAEDGGLARYQVTAELMRHAGGDAVFLHCPPIHRGKEVAAEVVDGLQSAVWDQAANRVPAHQALLAVLILRDWPLETL